jgi:hypothetical protein
MRGALIALALMAGGAQAQTAPAPATPSPEAAMAAISGLKGVWLGDGWRILPDGKRVTFTQLMTIEPKAGGAVYTIEGKSLRTNEPGARPGSGSFGVITFEPARGYRFRSFSRGDYVDVPGEVVGPGVFRWTVPGAVSLRFTVDSNRKDGWDEIGERSTDGGKTWAPTYGVNATRIEVR